MRDNKWIKLAAGTRKGEEKKGVRRNGVASRNFQARRSRCFER